jgi:hypothetical protein
MLVFGGNLSAKQAGIFGTLKKTRLNFSVNKTVFYNTAGKLLIQDFLYTWRYLWEETFVLDFFSCI